MQTSVVCSLTPYTPSIFARSLFGLATAACCLSGSVQPQLLRAAHQPIWRHSRLLLCPYLMQNSAEVLHSAHLEGLAVLFGDVQVFPVVADNVLPQLSKFQIVVCIHTYATLEQSAGGCHDGLGRHELARAQRGQVCGWRQVH